MPDRSAPKRWWRSFARERVGMVGGQLAAGPTPDGGFSIDVTLPWDPADAGRRLPEAGAGRDAR